VQKDSRWTVAELGEVLPALVARAAPNADLSGQLNPSHA
jgi:hypothetical protein